MDKVTKIIDYGGESNDKETKWHFVATFEDGTKLMVIAKAPAAPLADMTPQPFTSLELTAGMEVKQTDNGTLEMWDLQEQSAARRVMTEIQKMLEARQE